MFKKLNRFNNEKLICYDYRRFKKKKKSTQNIQSSRFDEKVFKR